MASQSPAPAETPAEVKTEESALNEANGTANAPSTATGITKQELEVMDGVVHQLTSYRTEEYIQNPSYRIYSS
jgi:hypothetical protein